ncbi:MAG: NADP-dependent malic enzyme [Alphaproteobacteria bacterium]
MSDNVKISDEEALRFHAQGKPGKLEIVPTKPMATQRDLSLAYSPGVAVPVQAIADNPDLAFDYTTRGNTVAVISNGSAILGMGDLGALASKPVMEGKAVLFKRFADVDSIDLEVDTHDVDEFINAVKLLGPSFGGINLEDIKAPDCFIIEQRLRELMDIPVFHDDQHGTAIIAAAGLINAVHLTGRKMEDLKIVSNGAGAASIACVELIKAMGVPHENILLCDRKGVIYQGREESMNQWKSAHAVQTEARSLEDALKGADVFLGLSVAGALTADMVTSMAEQPIIFAMANPIPEIMPEEAKKVRPDAIIATGRSDYPNQVNNVLGFPYIFRGALDVRATTINEEMKIAAAESLAKLAREDVPDEVASAYAGARPKYGPDYIIPAPFDPRLISTVPVAVAEAAVRTGVARKNLEDRERYATELSARLDPTVSSLQSIISKVQQNPKRIVFAEGEEEQVIRAALSFRDNGLGTPILVGREHRIRETMLAAGLDRLDGVEIYNARVSDKRADYANFLYERLQRQGMLMRDCQRLVNTDRNIFAACMVAQGDADGMVTGVTRNTSAVISDVLRVIDPLPGKKLMGATLVVARGRTFLVSDTLIHELPQAQDLVHIAEMSAQMARRFGLEPRVAMLAYSNFGQPEGERSRHVREAVRLLDARNVDFEYEGEMSPSVALDFELSNNSYPFSRLTGPANVLVMPAIHSAAIGTKLLQKLGGATLIGPLLVGLSKPVQCAPMGATVSDLVNLAALTAYELNDKA